MLRVSVVEHRRLRTGCLRQRICLPQVVVWLRARLQHIILSFFFPLFYRVSNLKYGSVRIDSKTVVFIRDNPGKKETTDRSGSHVNSIQKQCTFPEVVSPEKWYVTNIKPWAR